MSLGAVMLKHRGFPSRMRGSDLQFTIRRGKPGGGTPLVARKRYADRRAVDRAADRLFLGALIEHFGADPFERGNLDAGRLSWLIGREVVAVEATFDPADYAALLRVDLAAARLGFPELFEAQDGAADAAGQGDDDWDASADDAEDRA